MTVPTSTTHLFVTAAPALGHIKPLCVFACKLLIAYRRVRSPSSLIITMPVAGSNIKVLMDKEVERCLHSENESLRENFHIISVGGEGIPVMLWQHLIQNFTPFYTSLHTCAPIQCQATGQVYTVDQSPTVVIADYHIVTDELQFFMLSALTLIRQLNEQDQKKIPILTWNCGTLGPTMRYMGPERLGGIGDLEAKAKELAEKTGISFNEAEAQCFQPQKGEVIKVPGLPPMYDYEFYAQSEILPLEILAIQIMLHKQAYQMFHDFEGIISLSNTAFEPEACSASREWYAERNKSCYIAGPSLPDDLFDDSEGLKAIDLSPEEAEVMTFIDNVYKTSGKHSMLYIAFGTLFPPSSPKLWKVIEVVLDLKIPFLVVYGAPKFGEYGAMPDHIAEKMNASPERALICKWAPQQAVLAHKATGWFLTHCGHNGVFEAISQAVPMIGWPLDAEQPGTAALIASNLDIAFELIEVRSGLGLKPMYRGCQPKGTMEALQEEVRTVLQEAFHGKEGLRKRKNIQELREKIKDGLKENGDTTKDLMRFIEEYL
ncbi:hypothetical protein Clacol_010447 [Clathrus columnatus]|uniref:Uncharacterized protein n=1 Tax=Clathrus columnatus TaxID=1419009 RepID=A0AAV5AQX2_9AGAM|nr:hypothetical protein Clacol_010447 [Clathrus columnatus]